MDSSGQGGGEPNPTDTVDVLKCLRCAQDGCTNVPGYGYQGEGPTMCSEHATPVMVAIVSLRCEHPQCNARRTFGFDGSEARLCAAHKLDGMVDLMKRRSQVSFWGLQNPIPSFLLKLQVGLVWMFGSVKLCLSLSLLLLYRFFSPYEPLAPFCGAGLGPRAHVPFPPTGPICL